jgi:IMP dehydrogenase
VLDPITVTPETTIRQVMDLTKARGISGVPVVVGNQLVGIVTSRDLRFETRYDQPDRSVMTPKERLVTVRENAPRDQVLALFHKHRIEKVLVVGDDGSELKGMITVKDIQKATERPRACKDEGGRLRCGAAVGTSPDTLDRVARCARPASTWSWSTPRTAIPAACSRWSSRSRRAGPSSR